MSFKNKEHLMWQNSAGVIVTKETTKNLQFLTTKIFSCNNETKRDKSLWLYDEKYWDKRFDISRKVSCSNWEVWYEVITRKICHDKMKNIILCCEGSFVIYRQPLDYFPPTQQHQLRQEVVSTYRSWKHKEHRPAPCVRIAIYCIVTPVSRYILYPWTW